MISIFRTDVATSADLSRVAPFLNGIMKDLRWTIDLSDCDKILRVKSGIDKNDEIISVVKSLGFDCENLATFYSEP